MVAQYGPRFTHCWASCEIRKNCGMQTATDFGMAKEWADYGMCAATLGFGSRFCDSAFQDTDAIDNERGRSCPAKQACWDRCESLIGPDAPPGPFSKGPFWWQR